jgi:DNA-binding Xre family transcriptional regulator
VTDTRWPIHRFKLFSYERPDPETALVLESTLDHALLGPEATVPFDELVEILKEEHAEDFCIAAQWIESVQRVVLWRGNFTMLPVELGWFRAAGAPEPDPRRLRVEDYGRTICLGDCEASFDAVLYERDAAARRRMRARMREKDRTLGGSIRRLRELRGLRRDDFDAIDEKTIARIERGEVKRPRRATLEAIASRLGVAVEELKTY